MNLLAELNATLADESRSMGFADAGADAIERPRRAGHGDYSCALAMRMARPLGRAPKEIAQQLAARAAEHPAVADAQVAAPGFVNISLTPQAQCAVVGEALADQESFGRLPQTGTRMLLEFVSANPTGPLHIGHGRAAAVGDSLARILRFAGVQVDTEYYLNDRGLQTDVLAASLWLRVLERRGAWSGEPPAGLYAGDYLAPIAERFEQRHAGVEGGRPDYEGLPENDADAAGLQAAARTREALGADFEAVRDFAAQEITAMIAAELEHFGVEFDKWHSEKAMAERGEIEEGLALLERRGCTYAKDGAVWFSASEHGDEKDWVIVRSNGEQTYFASDVAYHKDKYARGYDIVYDLVGADHHGYIPRLQALIAALGEDVGRFEAGLIQFVSLVNAGGRVKMSTRAGTFHTLADLVAATGVSAARLFFVLSKGNAPMDFDVARAERQSNDNPVYYIQYAHARSCSLLEKWGGRVGDLGAPDPAALADPEARAMMTEMRWFSHTVATAARERAPHIVAHWLVALAAALHSYYDKVPVLAGEKAGLDSRVALVAAARQTLANGMGLLGVEAPARM